MKQVIIMRGLPGSGKSRKARGLATVQQKLGGRAIIVSADDHFMTRVEGEPGLKYVFDPKQLAEAHSNCFGHFLQALRAGFDLVIVDNTNVRRWEYVNYRTVAEMMGYEVEVEHATAEMHESAHIRVADLREWARRNEHGVSLETVAAMAVRWED